MAGVRQSRKVMRLIRELIKWFYCTFWLIWSLLLIVAVHKLILLPCLGSYVGYTSLCTDESAINEVYAALIQISGALLVLYSIDSNLGLLKKTDLLSLSLDAFRKFPLLNQTTNVRATATLKWAINGNIKARGCTQPKSVDEHLEFLQIQIDRLKNDLEEQKLELVGQLNEVKDNHSKENNVIKENIEVLENKLVNSTIGSLKPQLFGILLVCYGAYLNVA